MSYHRTTRGQFALGAGFGTNKLQPNVTPGIQSLAPAPFVPDTPPSTSFLRTSGGLLVGFVGLLAYLGMRKEK